MFNNTVYDKATLGADGFGTAFNFKGGRLVLGAFGTFGGGTVGVQYTTDADVTWVAIPLQNGVAMTATAAATLTFFLPPGRYRVSLAGSTAPSLSYWIGDANAGG